MASRRTITALRVPAALTAVSVVAVLVALPAPIAAAAVGDPSVSSVTVTPTTVTLSRKQTRTITVSLRLVSSAGQQSAPVVVDRGHGVGLARSPLILTPGSGDDTDGTWTAALTASAVMDGVHPLWVEVCPVGRDCTTNGPVRLSLAHSVTVNGSDWPVLTHVTQEPRRLAAGHSAGADAVGHVVFRDSRVPAQGVDVVLRHNPAGSGVVVDRSNASGAFTSPWPWPSGSGSAVLALRLPHVPGVTFGRHALGFPATAFAVQTTRAPAIATPGHRYTVRGVVTPGFPARRLGSVVLEERRGDRWVTMDRSRLSAITQSGEPTRRAGFTLTTDIKDVGRHSFRVRKPAALCGVARCRVSESTSRPFEVVTGNRAYYVERKLSKLEVPVGEVDGVVDARTLQALCAWRDMSGRNPNRDGLSRRLANSVLTARRLPKPNRSDGLYVNQTCQILFQVVDHRFRRVVWASSGQPGFETPNGTGAIFRKLQGPVESTLYPGAFMYHPMFFLPSRPAIALHGSATNDLVLPYPASHGCVRVWRPTIFELFQESPLGTKVKVYGKY